MSKIIKLRESELALLVNNIIKEITDPTNVGPGEVPAGTTKPVKQTTVKASPKPSNSAPKSPSYLLFDGKTLKLIVNGNVTSTYNAWSGRTKWNATSRDQKLLVAKMTNKIDFMKIKNAGPIPEGTYYLGSIQKRTKGDSLKLVGTKDWYQILKMYSDEYGKIGDRHEFNLGTAQDMIAWGNYRMSIIPKGGTETYGRGSFYLHGGGLGGSIGCIDLVDRIDDFISTYKSFLSKTGSKTIDLIVDYSGKIKVSKERPPYAITTPPENVGYPKSDKTQDAIDKLAKQTFIPPMGN